MFNTNIGINRAAFVFLTVRRLIKHAVRKMAIGSLLPDSNSSKGLKGSLRLMRFDLRILNTAAASVEETIDPISMASKKENLKMRMTNNPVRRAVIKTPAVDSAAPGLIMGLISFHLVLKPPANIIKTRATRPVDSAILALLKSTPPIPSEPASIPIPRNSNNTGMANLSESLLETTLTNINAATHIKTVLTDIIVF
jgi:hypothetical protein